jgi:hypothetical protein
MMDNIATGHVGFKSKVGWQRMALAVGIVLLLGLALWMIVSQVAAGGLQNKQAAAKATFEEQTGIRILRVVMTAGGGMIDLQYQVLDPDKSLIVHDDEDPPQLIDVASGQIVATPFHDHSARELHTAVTYHEIIMNGDGLLQRGSRVTLLVSDSKLENLIVQ